MAKKEKDTRRNFLKRASLGLGVGLTGIQENLSGYEDLNENNVSEKLLTNAKIILETSCRAKSGESLLILADEKLLQYSTALVEAALELNLIPVVLDIRAFLASEHYEEGYVLKTIVSAMESSDIVIENLADTWVPNRPDFGRLTGDYTNQDKALSGERRWVIVQCDGMDKWDISSEEVFNIRKRTLWLANLLKTAKSGRIKTTNGTDFIFGLDNYASYKPILGIVPLYGEVAIVPNLETTYGEFVVDGPTQRDVRPADELDKKPIRITVEKGIVKNFDGDKTQEQRLKRFIESGDPLANAIDEVGILTTNFRENDLYYWSDGTHHHDRVHIALGNNVLRDTLVHGPKHMDCEVSKPTITIDGIEIVKEGIFQDKIINGL